MGNAASQPSYHKLDRIFPHNYGQTSMFVDYADRQQFIRTLLKHESSSSSRTFTDGLIRTIQTPSSPFVISMTLSTCTP